MIRLRPAEPADEQAAWDLRREIQPALTREEHRTWWTEVREHRFLAYDGAALVGIIRVSQGGVRKYQGELHILVTMSERGKGRGAQMLEAIKPVMRNLGYPSLWARVEAANVPSQQAFMAAGYAPTRFEVEL